jgi:ADP-ribosylglycohydrolase
VPAAREAEFAPTEELRRRMTGCWMGKAVGGTLGQTFEGQEGPLDATFYTPVPTEMEANDDLDLQVLWAVLMDQLDDVRVDRRVLERGWLQHVEFPWNEYGVGIRNLRDGLAAPLSGAHDNWFTCGEGAAIRTEIWACLAAGDPALAARYAYEDACVDHAGDGVNAALFLASVQAAAFVEADPDRLLDIGLAAIPADSRLAAAVTDTRGWVAEGLAWPDVRGRILEHYGSVDFTDVRQNTAFVVLGWLAGRDFSERILICNNCGKDTDSSTASLGSILGILDPASIGEEWLAPIGRNLVLNPEIKGITPPDTLDEFTELVLSLRARLAGQPPRPGGAESRKPPVVSARVSFTDRYRHRSRIGTRFMPGPYDPEPALDGTEQVVVLDGTWHRMPRADFGGDVAILRYDIVLERDQLVRLMFNTTEQCWVSVDGVFAFGRETGAHAEPAAMFPALHGPPLNQYVDRQLAAGTHTLTALVRRPVVDRAAEWVVAVADQRSGMWVNGAIAPSGGG